MVTGCMTRAARDMPGLYDPAGAGGGVAGVFVARAFLQCLVLWLRGRDAGGRAVGGGWGF